MQRRTFKAALGLAITVAALCVPQLATAQAWPAKQPIKFVAVFHLAAQSIKWRASWLKRCPCRLVKA